LHLFGMIEPSAVFILQMTLHHCVGSGKTITSSEVPLRASVLNE